MKVLIFDKGVLTGSKEWERPLLNQRRSALLKSNPEAFKFMRGLRTRASKKDKVSFAGKTLALNYLNLVLSQDYTETAEGRRDYISAKATKKAILEALQDAEVGVSVNQLCQKAQAKRERVQSAVSALRREKAIAYAQGSKTSLPLFCLADSPLFLSHNIEDCSAGLLIRRFLEQDGRLTCYEMASRTGYSTQMCRTVANNLVRQDEAWIAGRIGPRDTAIYELINEKKQKCA